MKTDLPALWFFSLVTLQPSIVIASHLNSAVCLFTCALHACKRCESLVLRTQRRPKSHVSLRPHTCAKPTLTTQPNNKRRSLDADGDAGATKVRTQACPARMLLSFFCRLPFFSPAFSLFCLGIVVWTPVLIATHGSARCLHRRMYAKNSRAHFLCARMHTAQRRRLQGREEERPGRVGGVMKSLAAWWGVFAAGLPACAQCPFSAKSIGGVPTSCDNRIRSQR